jgi:hypothetical protein
MPKRTRYEFKITMTAHRREANKLHAAAADAVEKAREDEAIGAEVEIGDIQKPAEEKANGS